jgi:NAD(P)-dependent dehydrogenase (short-subunit alcohol dehydrogenase family)
MVAHPSFEAAREAYRGPADLADQIAVVTGGAQGLGETIARLFAERGAAGLVICGRDAGVHCSLLRAYLCSDESGLMTGANIDFDQNVVGASDAPIEP